MINKKTAINIIFGIFFFLTIAPFVLAAQYPLEIPIPVEGGTSVSGPGDYIRIVFLFGLGLVGITALGAIVFGGIVYLTSGGNETRAGYGKSWIKGAVLGLVLLLCSYLILNTINPDLVSLKDPKLEKIQIVPEWWEKDKPQEEDEPKEPKPEPEKKPTAADAGSQDIIDLTSCIANAVPSGYTRAPYVDSQIANCTPCRANCTGCSHACYSDHYGCRCGDGLSHAVDLQTANPSLQCQLAQAAQACASQIGGGTRVVYGSNAAAAQCPQYLSTWPGHGTHVHISLNCR